MKPRSSARGGGEPRKRLRNAALLALMLCSLVALSVIRARFSPIASAGGEPLKLNADESKLVVTTKQAVVNTESGDDAADESSSASSSSSSSSSSGAAAAEEEEDAPARPGGGDGGKQAVCHETSRRSDTCEAAGDVRVVGSSQIVYADAVGREWKTKPYCRKHDAFALSHVKEWTLRPLPPGGDGGPRCTTNSTATAFVLSTGGFTGNPFHDYTDVLIPAFITAHRFAGEVQFLVSSYKPWWMNKYIQIFQRMSRYEVLDIDADAADEVRCYRRAVVGPEFHRELGVDPSKTPSGYSVLDFRSMLRGAFGLDRATATPSGDRWDIRRRPRLLIISRRAARGRAFTNERAMADMAASLGFDVRVGEPDASTDTSKFARLVNSCDVMVGVHGAGLTNMVFLPAGAVLVQVVPYGKLEWLARNTFAEPSAAMELHYLEYAVQLDETTLSEQYPPDHPVLRDPMAIHKQGWEALKTTYLDKQNVRPHLGRLKNTFLQALKLLPHDKETMN
ncbi:alpha-1,3-arabinosyltransferase XAT3-like [Oryza brachyantha]|uniref:Glycosyltransferase 61 catalytic domain-containing protein n=1 Tax=Oryza brachyantha TaxID=4533 RepID=J3N3N3_ORYBR|nr:alpha-1,3-arabinosyltransferase XAT3-like [Oryza brachyantha]